MIGDLAVGEATVERQIDDVSLIGRQVIQRVLHIPGIEMLLNRFGDHIERCRLEPSKAALPLFAPDPVDRPSMSEHQHPTEP